MLPNIGPGCALSFVNHIAIPSPNRCVDSPEIYATASNTQSVPNSSVLTGCCWRRKDKVETDLELDLDDVVRSGDRQTGP